MNRSILVLAIICIAAPSALAQTSKDIKQKIIGLNAYAMCKVRNSGYSIERASAIIDKGMSAQGWNSYKPWLKTKGAANAVNLTGLSMNKSCTDINPRSIYFKDAIKAMEAIGL